MDEAVLVLAQSLVFLIGSLVSATSLYNLYQAGLALRAKRRAHYEVAHTALTDMKLKQALKQLSLQNLDADDMQKLVKEFDRIITSLPAKDQKLVREGLHQENRAGAKRFLKDVAAA
jgi:hypothetical protein